jgi:SAM-dependent methyltransferase
MIRLGRLFGLGERPMVPHDAYALWAENYPPRPHNPLMESEASAVGAIVQGLRPRRALDVGTGTGRNLALLAGTGAETVVGLDLSLPMLRQNTAGRPRTCGDARRLPFQDASFDLICASLMAGDIPFLADWIGEAARVLAPGGHLVYSDFHPAGTSKGWRRTFQVPGERVRELIFFPHTIEEHLHLIEQATLVVRAIREPRIERQAPPVIVVFHAVKRC